MHPPEEEISLFQIKEPDESVNIQVVSSRSGEDISFFIQDEVVGLGVDPETLEYQVGIDSAHVLEDFAFVIGNPFVFRKSGLVIYIKGYYHKVVLQAAQYLRRAPYAGFHLAAVDAAVAAYVNEYFLPLLGRGGNAIVQAAVSDKAMGE